jgi:hypothetical protein
MDSLSRSITLAEKTTIAILLGDTGGKFNTVYLRVRDQLEQQILSNNGQNLGK